MGFIVSLSTGVQILLIISILLIVFSTLATIIYITKKSRIKFGDVEIGNQKIESENKNRPSVHADCKSRSDIVVLLLEQQEMLNKKYHILDKEIMAMCMKEVEEEIHKIYYQIIETFRETVANTEEYSSELSKNFENYLECVKGFVLDQFRLWIRENHFAEKTEAEFDLYSANKAENLENYIENFSSKSQPEIKSEKYHENVKDVYPQMRFATIMVLKKCRTISIQKQEEVSLLENCFNEKVSTILGVSYNK